MAEKEGILQSLFYMQAAFADIITLWQKRADPSKISYHWAFSVVLLCLLGEGAFEQGLLYSPSGPEIFKLPLRTLSTGTTGM